MNTDVKRRIVMSLVSLALAFGLLATYYIVTVPWNRTAVGQALTAGALLGIASLVVQFIPIRQPVPVAAAPAPAPEPVAPARAWRPEPEFEPDDFAFDLSGHPGSAESTVTPTPLAAPGSPTAFGAATPIASASTSEIPVIVNSPAPPPGPTPLQQPEPLLPSPVPPMLPSAESLLSAIRVAETVPSAEQPLTVSDIKETVAMLRGRNDDVMLEEFPPMPEAAALAVPSFGARIDGPASKPTSRKLPLMVPNGTEWREPDPEAPKELLRELAEYWHVKYEHEKRGLHEVQAKYEEVLRRLEQLENVLATEKEGTRPRTTSTSALTIDDLSVEDSVRQNRGADLEDQWDQRAGEIERFH